MDEHRHPTIRRPGHRSFVGADSPWETSRPRSVPTYPRAGRQDHRRNPAEAWHNRNRRRSDPRRSRRSMRYVLDSTVALKIALPEPDSAKAIQLRDDFRNGIHELLAIDVFPIEVGHALTRAERQRRILP